MKQLVLIFLVLKSTNIKCQVTADFNRTPDSKLSQPASYKMKWFIQKDSLKKPLGTIITKLDKTEEHLIISQQVVLNSTIQPWIDSTIADVNTLIPIYHSSYNSKRDMVLNYKLPYITGHYFDKVKKNEFSIHDTCDGQFYDSNIVPFLLCWLPLKEGYKTKIPVYNFGAPSIHGLKQIYVTNTKEAVYQLPRGEKEVVFIIDVFDEENFTTTTYYIGKFNRAIYEIEIKTDNGLMKMQLDA